MVMPPVPAAYLRPPYGSGVLFKPKQPELQLADVALAAVSHSQNPAIANAKGHSTPHNHKLAPSPHNALPPPPPAGDEVTNHKHRKNKGGNHRQAGKTTPLVESSAAEQSNVVVAAPRRPPPNHRPPPLPPPRNHRPGHLRGDESMTSPRYRKRPLGPLEQVSTST